MIKTLSTVMQLGLRVPVFSYMWVLLQDISDLIRGYRERYIIIIITTHVFHNL